MMTKVRLLFIILTFVVVGIGAYAASLYARGYRIDTATMRFTPNGILVIKSDPDGAQVLLNGELKTATNTTLSLTPGIYDVIIRKDGYLQWQKRLTIDKEVVTDANASLFKSAPSLSSLTFYGVVNPVFSSDYTRIVYGVLPNTSSDAQNRSGLWAMETINLPIGFSRDPIQITDKDITDATWQISPDGRQLLLTTKTGVFLLDTTRLNQQNLMTNVSSRKDQILNGWQLEETNKLQAQMRNLPPEMVDLLSRKVSSVVFSPDQTKVLYTASGEATLKDGLIKALPGASTQKQDRDIKVGKTYVYDIKEDRNFLIDEGKEPLIIDSTQSHISKVKNAPNRRLSWFPTSRHLVLAEDSKVIIMDYDATNQQVVYSGAYDASYAVPFSSTDRLLILTNLGAASSPSNFYFLSLK